MTIDAHTPNGGMSHRAGSGREPVALPRWMPRLRSSRLVGDIYAIGEMVIVLLCGLAAAVWHVGHNLGSEGYLRDYSTPLVMLPLIFVLLARGNRLYEFQALCSVSQVMGRTIGCLLIAFAAVIATGFALGIANDYSRLWLGLWLAAGIAGVIVARIAPTVVLLNAARAGLIRRRVAVLGNPGSAGLLEEEIARGAPEMHLVGTFVTRGRRPWSDDGEEQRMLDDFIAFAQRQDIDLVIVARDAVAHAGLHDTLSALSVLPAEVRLFLDFGEGGIPVRGVSSLNGLSLLEVQRRPISGWNRLVKNCEDYAVAAVATVLLSPLLLMIALAIRLDSAGPVFFRQRRHGFNHNIIHVWKFRTMHVMEDGDDMVQASRGDSRVTRVGRILRKTSLDELPQLFNVLKGEMSIVGPRPHPLALNNRYVEMLERYGNRHKVKPGITGWAQINGFRGPTEDPILMQRRVELDLEYIERWSIWMDLRIIALTPFRGLMHRNAL